MTSLRNYLIYLYFHLRHKQHVWRECSRRGLYWRGLTHDWTKFLPPEFCVFAEYWLEWGWPRLKDRSIVIPPDVYARFRRVHDRHKQRNRHHWEHWVSVGPDGRESIREMDRESVLEMLCDWEAVGRMFHDAPGARRWYRTHGPEMKLGDRTRELLEELLQQFPQT